MSEADRISALRARIKALNDRHDSDLRRMQSMVDEAQRLRARIVELEAENAALREIEVCDQAARIEKLSAAMRDAYGILVTPTGNIVAARELLRKALGDFN